MVEVGGIPGSGTCLVPALMVRSGGTRPSRVPGGRRGATTGVMGVQTELGYLFMRQSTVTSGEFPASLAYEVHTWKFGALFRRGLVSGSLVSGVWVLLVEFRYWIFREMLAAFLWSAMLGSTVNTYSASVRDAFGRIAHNFCVAVDSNPEVLVSVLVQNGEVCSVDASDA